MNEQRLDLAAQMAVTDVEDGETLDIFRYADYDWRRDAFLRDLTRRLRLGTYRAQTPLELTFPKSEFAVRPLRRIELEDLTVLFYVTHALAEDLEDKLPAGVTAYRFKRGKDPEIREKARYLLPRYIRQRLRLVDPWYDAWPTFIKRLRREYENGRRFVGTTDITSFYDDIDIEMLRAVLRDRVRAPHRPLVNILCEIYEGWSMRDIHLRRQSRAIPQGTNSSGPIANYFLLAFDEALKSYSTQHDLRWFRYSDDLRLVGRQRENVRLGLRQVGAELGRLNLIQNASKTKILTGAEARLELFDPRPDAILGVAKLASRGKLTTAVRERAIRKMTRYAADIRGKGLPFSKSDSRAMALLYLAFGDLKSDHLLTHWRRDLLAEPTRATTILNYVARFLDRGVVRRALLAHVDAQRNRATDWETAVLLRYLRRAPVLPVSAVPLLKRLAQAKQGNWYVRQQAIACIAWFRVEGEAARLARLMSTEWDDEVLRASATVLYLVPEAQQTEILLRSARSESPKLARMANFLLALREDRELALTNLDRFSHANAVFFADSVWRLYQIRLNPDVDVRSRLKGVLARTERLLPNRAVAAHLKALAQLA